jgi:single-strand DNA-binding protein
MASVNKVILIGNLGRDPEMRFLPDSTAVASLALATTEKYKDKNGQMQESTEWHRVSFFGRTAEICQQYLKKGSSIYVEGSIKTKQYQDKTTGETKYTTEIKGSNLTMLGGKSDSISDQPTTPPPMKQAPSTTASVQDLDDDIPF